MRINIVKEAKDLLENAHISDALETIARDTEAIGMYEISERAFQLKNDYSLLLSYFASGANDPSRQDMLANIIDKAYTLLDTIKFCQNKKHLYIPLSDVTLSDHQSLFDAVENNFPASREDRQRIQQIILDENLPLYLRGMVLSALTLNLLKYFDNEKFESLYTYTLEDQPLAIQARAWVAIVLVAMAHDIRISTQPRLVEQLKFLCEEGMKSEDDGIHALLTIQFALIQSHRGQNVRETLRGQIAADISKGLKEIREHSGEDEEEFMPRWEEYIEKSGIHEKVQKFLELQQHGVDIMYDAFSKMRNISFLNDRCNWFMPFDPENPLIKKILEKSNAKARYAQLIAKSGNMSSTDKYSNIFITSMLPDSQFTQLDTMLQSGIDVDRILEPSADDHIVGYIHDLYRYYTLYSKSSNEYNPFNQKLFFGSYAGLQNIMTTTNEIELLANMLIESENWKEAVNVMTILIETDLTEKNLQRLAFCINKRDEDHVDSLSILSKCNYLYPGNKWTMKNYAKSLNAVHDFTAEENILREGCKTFPNDIGFVVSLAECLMDQDRFQEAMEQLFKADMMKENNYRTCSNLAFCAFALQNKKVAEKYIEMTLAMPKADSRDWIHGGHIALWGGNIPLAIERYCKAHPDDLEYYFLVDEINFLLDAGVPIDVITLSFEVAKQKINS